MSVTALSGRRLAQVMFIRHGEAEHNVPATRPKYQHDYTGPEGVLYDAVLTERGKRPEIRCLIQHLRGNASHGRSEPSSNVSRPEGR